MKLTKIAFTKSDLENLPKAERDLFIAMAHAANELNILSKLFQISFIRPLNEIERQSMVAQALLLARLLAGKLYEAWNLLKPAFFGSKMSKIYEPMLNSESKIALAEIKKYFSGNNSISVVRNEFAFHYSVEQISSGFNNLREETPLNIYLGEHNSNTMYSFSDDVVNAAMLEAIAPGAHHRAIDVFMDETSKISGLFGTLLGGCMAVALQKYLGGTEENIKINDIFLNGAPEWKDVKIPFFTESPKNFSIQLKNGIEIKWGDTSLMAPNILANKADDVGGGG